MARLQGLGPLDARRFRTGRPSLDFVHTGGDGTFAVFELIREPDDVARWLAVILDVDRVEIDIGEEDDSVERVRALRRTIWNGAHRLMQSRQLSKTQRHALNTAAAAPPCIPCITSDGAAAIRRPVTLDQALSTLARDAIDLATSPLAARVRECAAPDCRFLFVDQSRPGARRWCSMERCGTLAKVRKHRAASR